MAFIWGVEDGEYDLARLNFETTVVFHKFGDVGCVSVLVLVEWYRAQRCIEKPLT